jgi:glucose/arabinose dehydrogenase
MHRFFVRVTSAGLLAATLPAFAAAQVTNGKKPDLPKPFATESAGNAPQEVKRPSGFLPTVPNGFHVNVYAESFKTPRLLTIAPNGDLFVAESGAGRIEILRDPKNVGSAQERETFAANLRIPFGIAFKDDYVYIGNTDEIVRFRYDPKTSKRLGESEALLKVPGGGHATRTLAIAPDGKHLLIAVGSAGNIETDDPPIRAAITICDLDGKNARQYATGLRNPVGLALNPATGEVWTSVNERDELGDDLPPDYFTSVQDGGFYGWPYSYIGSNVDPRVKQDKPALVMRAIVPDVLLGAHIAPLQFAFYTGKQFPESYRGGAFLAEHGSWNRAKRSGYQVVFIGFKDGRAAQDPVPFMTGFVPDPMKGLVYGRPVGVAVLPDGSIVVSDDGVDNDGILYRVSYGK